MSGVANRDVANECHEHVMQEDLSQNRYRLSLLLTQLNSFYQESGTYLLT